LGSGALVTARFALEQNRDVFVVPGPITHPNFVGSNQLIRNGAELITKPEEIMEAFGMETAGADRASELIETDAEKKIIAALKNFSSPVGVDKILELTNLSISEANRALAYLTIKNIVKETGDGYSL
jgi:DNA processing protein